ncbi:hypothetical protein [uncultured Mediterranean phage]|nr:hypothetical protein [uncultured Mediterranean phage]
MASNVEIEKGAGIKQFERQLRNPVSLLRDIGSLVASRLRESFPKQQRFGRVWDERMTPNIPGILQDLGEGKTKISNHRFEPRPVLIDKRKLMNSFRWKATNQWVDIGTDREGAALQHFGGPSEVDITDEMKKNLKKSIGDRQRKVSREQRLGNTKSKVDQWIVSHGSAILGKFSTKKDATDIRKGTYGHLDGVAITAHRSQVDRKDVTEKQLGADLSGLAWLLKLDKFKFTVRPRPFMGLEIVDRRDIMDMVVVSYVKAWTGGKKAQVVR